MIHIYIRYNQNRMVKQFFDEIGVMQEDKYSKFENIRF